jgi:hypothetical protein
MKAEEKKVLCKFCTTLYVLLLRRVFLFISTEILIKTTN